MDTTPPGESLRLICGGARIPRLVNFQRLSHLGPNLSGQRLTAIANWLIMELRRESNAESASSVSRALLSVIVEVGDPAAVQELRRVRAAANRANQAIVTAATLQCEDRVIGQMPPMPTEGSLLDFINLPNHAMVRDERDLFEAVCQAIDNIKSELEYRGEGVAGFWNGSNPKTEPDCQNVLWPRLRDKLFHFGITGVEERYVGANRVDFSGGVPRPAGKFCVLRLS